jgi:hypothetical protein
MSIFCKEIAQWLFHSQLTSSIVFKRNAFLASGTTLSSTLQTTETIKWSSTVGFSPCMTKTTKAHKSREARERVWKEKRMPSIPFHCIKSTCSLSTGGELTINPDDERVIYNCSADERSWPSNLEMGWVIWLGDDKIWFWGEQKTTVITKQAGVWCRRGVAGGGVG